MSGLTSMSNTNEYFASDQDWEAYAERHGMSLKLDTPKDEVVNLEPMLADMRANQAVEEADWAKGHPLDKLGYEAQLKKIKVRDGAEIEIKVFQPVRQTSTGGPLPLLFICHGGGWIGGTHLTEERWLLHPLMQDSEFVAISVAYRLAPENPYPAYVNDCWDAFQYVANRREVFGIDRDNMVVAGSSAGALLAAVISQKAQTAGLPIGGVILNVPVLCDYRHWPSAFGLNKAYAQASGALLSSGVMRGVWDLVVPEEEGKTDQASPLLGDVRGLPPHAIFAAGQDCLRDEAIAYAHKLKDANVDVDLVVYPGVPHTFGELYELKSTQQFHKDLVAVWKKMIV